MLQCSKPVRVRCRTRRAVLLLPPGRRRHDRIRLLVARKRLGDEAARLQLLDEGVEIGQSGIAPLGVPIACSMAMKRPSITRTLGSVLA